MCFLMTMRSAQNPALSEKVLLNEMRVLKNRSESGILRQRLASHTRVRMAIEQDQAETCLRMDLIVLESGTAVTLLTPDHA